MSAENGVLRILLVHDYAVPTGGAEILTLALRDGLRLRGHEVRVFASSARPGGGEGFADDEALGSTSALGSLLQAGNPHASWRLRRVLSSYRPDVVHVGMFLTQLSPLILPWLRRFPAVYQAHWVRPVCPIGTKTLPDGTACRVSPGLVCYRSGCLPLRHWAPRMVQLRLLKRWRSVFDRIVVHSEAAGRLLASEGFGPLEIVPPGVPEAGPRPALDAPPTIGFAGRLVEPKGADVLLRAFARVAAHVPAARLVLVGDGPERVALVALASSLGISDRVTMAGQRSRRETEEALASAWVQVVPSRGFEGFGLVAAEAMMRGTAVVASDAGGLGEIIEHGRTGFLVPPGDPDALGEALLVLARDRSLAERMGQAGRAVALRRYREEAFVERFVSIYRTLCR